MPYNDMCWTHGDLVVTFGRPEGFVGITSVSFRGREVAASVRPLPLAEVGVVGAGRAWSARRFVDSEVGASARPESFACRPHAEGESLVVESRDEQRGLRITTVLTSLGHGCALRVETTVENVGPEAVDLSWVTSGVLAGVLGREGLERGTLWDADNDWLAEYRWRSRPVRDVLPDLHRAAHEHDPRGVHARTANGAWSTDGALPVGVLVDAGTGAAVAWEVAHNGPWHWQVGERDEQLFVSALGPEEAHHEWGVTVAPGSGFTAVPMVLGLSDEGFEGAIASLTAARRALRRPHDDHRALPVIFNDYMNTLMGDPTTAKLLPLVDAAAAAGAEIFCIDAGWYDDAAGGWWDTVGAWEPAASRFPGGIGEVVDHITARGMRAGLWLEPEVVGVNSPLADALPDEAFLQRRGRRVVEHGRLSLDLRHPQARKHLDAVVDRLVDGLGVSYFKLDYNINPGNGTDTGGLTAGAGLLEHNRAHLTWLTGVLDRHPGLTVENCASGGMRVDQAMLAVLQVQSTSDQQDPLLYPPIAAAAATAMAPEQAASWAYPQPEHSDDVAAFALLSGMLGRLQLSGHLDRMTPAQQSLVREAVTVHRDLRDDIPASRAVWPLGLPGWDDAWVAHGLRTDDVLHLAIWRRHGEEPTRSMVLPRNVADGDVAVLFPAAGDAEVALLPGDDGPTLRVTLPRAPQAVLLSVRLREAPA